MSALGHHKKKGAYCNGVLFRSVQSVSGNRATGRGECSVNGWTTESSAEVFNMEEECQTEDKELLPEADLGKGVLRAKTQD